MSQPFEAWIVDLIGLGDESLPDRVDGYLHDHLIRNGFSGWAIQPERDRIAAYVEANGPDTDLRRAVVDRFNDPLMPPTSKPDRVSEA